MKPRLTPRPPLADPQQAIMNYLEDLLSVVPPWSPEPVVEAPAPPSPRTAAPRPAPQPVPVPPPAQPVLAEPVLTKPVLAPPLIAPPPPAPAAPVPTPQTAPPAPVQRSAIPAWGGQPFKALACEIATMNLAVPLDQLRGIIPWNGELTRVPGTAPERLGRILIRGEQIEVIDLAQLLLGRPGPELGTQGYILLLGERWGLACSQLQDPELVAPSAVRWRRAPGRPPYLAGVLTGSLRPLLDLDEILARVAAGHRRPKESAPPAEIKGQRRPGHGTPNHHP